MNIDPVYKRPVWLSKTHDKEKNRKAEKRTVSFVRVSTPFKLVSPFLATDNHFKLVHIEILCIIPSHKNIISIDPYHQF